jgi:hypothetical protein
VGVGVIGAVVAEGIIAGVVVVGVGSVVVRISGILSVNLGGASVSEKT